MTEASIPILAYAFIGITTLVLTYVTIMDTEPNKKPTVSAISMLPTIQGTQSSSVPSATPSFTPSIPVAQPLMQTTPNPNAPQIKLGGKTKGRRNKNKNTKRRKY